ncbi:MAG: SH3 domain-containing protein [Pseudomonadota bacterium]|nr:SH3 domain-containing protein [Pseudomonadota bacterium]
MKYTCLTALIALTLVAGCSTGDDREGGRRATVQNVGTDDLLKLRAGPGLGYRVVLGLPDGTRLIRRNCVTEVGQLWCQVSLADAPGVRGYVAADYLTAN